jgi:hypothetical protein
MGIYVDVLSFQIELSCKYFGIFVAWKLCWLLFKKWVIFLFKTSGHAEYFCLNRESLMSFLFFIIICDTQHKLHLAKMTFSIMTLSIECRHNECYDYLNIILNVINLNVINLNVINLNVINLNVIMLSVIMMDVIMLSVIMQSVAIT